MKKIKILATSAALTLPVDPADGRPGQGLLDLGLERLETAAAWVSIHAASACGFSTPLTKRPFEGARRNSSNSISLHG